MSARYLTDSSATLLGMDIAYKPGLFFMNPAKLPFGGHVYSSGDLSLNGDTWLLRPAHGRHCADPF